MAVRVVELAEGIEIVEVGKNVKEVVMPLVSGTMDETVVEVELATEVAAVPSNAVANTKVPLTPAVAGMMVAKAVES